MKKPSFFFHLKQQRLCALEIPRDHTAYWLFNTGIGRIANQIISLPWFSRWAGYYAKSRLSRTKIASFRKEFRIDESDFIEQEYLSLNEYFIRNFKAHRRPFSQKPHEFAAPAEGYLLMAQSECLPVKGITANSTSLLNQIPSFAISYSCVIRLTPKEYHRFHFPMDGIILNQYDVPGRLYSINPTTLEQEPNLFIRNKRRVLHLRLNSGVQCYIILIGATYIGSIITHKSSGASFVKGEEAGYFEFGGSTAVLLFDQSFTANEQILTNSTQSIESYVELGTPIAQLFI